MTAVAGSLLAIALVGCSSSDVAEEGPSCVSDGDCASGEHCAPMGPGLRPMIALPCPSGLTVCSADADCPSGQVCEPATLDGKSDCGKACEPGCPSIPCATFQTCENARCRTLLCDEDGGLTCDEHWRCDPAAAADEPLENQGARELDGNAQNLIDVGCVRIRCGETGGFTCKDFNGGGWVCDPENATDGSGCVALPCEESGVCSYSNFICTTTSTNPRPAGVDPHGCVRKNCEEGAECTVLNPVGGMNVGYCDFAGPFADELGCATEPCQSDDECQAFEICDPGSGGQNQFGCRWRTCTEGYTCEAGFRCDPSSFSLTRCVSDGSGGAAGSGGGVSTAGSGGGVSTAGSGAAAGSGGASGFASSPGRCVAD